MRAPTRRDMGQATLLMLVPLALVLGLIAGAVHLGGRMADMGRAAAAADAAALAAIDGGNAAAAAAARLNGGVLIRLEPEGDDVVAEVRVGAVTARARATRAP